MTWTPAMEAELRYLIQREYRAQQTRDERWESTCHGKPGFATAAVAREARPRRALNDRVTVYRCPFCNRWHVGGHLSPKSRDGRPVARDEGVAA